jgi:hypothetical protein
VAAHELFRRTTVKSSQEHFDERKTPSHSARIIGGRRQQSATIMQQIKAYREAKPEDLATLLLPVGEIGAIALSAALVLVLVWVISGAS